MRTTSTYRLLRLEQSVYVTDRFLRACCTQLYTWCSWCMVVDSPFPGCLRAAGHVEQHAAPPGHLWTQYKMVVTTTGLTWSINHIWTVHIWSLIDHIWIVHIRMHLSQQCTVSYNYYSKADFTLMITIIILVYITEASISSLQTKCV